MCTRNQLEIIKRAITGKYSEVYGERLAEVILYGSYARSDNDEQSDIDIAAIVNGDRIVLQNELKKVWEEAAELSLEYDVIISPTVIPLNEYIKYKSTLPYYRNISREGIRIG